MVEVKNQFGAFDYVVFSAMLLVSVAIGIFFALKGGRQKTQGEYLLANRGLSVLPVAISILVSFLSAILILGTPAEMYIQGTEFFMSLFGMILGITFAAFLFVPLMYPLKITSAFEYLELRYQSRAVRLIGTILMISSQIIYMGIALFAPSTALEAVTGFPVWATILITGAVATFYTTIGGMKAVVWTDVFQSLVMVAGILAIVIQGTLKVGGLAKVWEINERWDRINFFNFDPDPTLRHSTWSLVIGSTLMWVGTYGLNQASVQRYSSLPTVQSAKRSVLLNTIGATILLTLTCLSGIVLFAYYAEQGCDPLGSKLVDNSNQLIPYFVMETLGYPGVPGLFVSSLFSGALSSVSSSLNALAAITWEDILKHFYDKKLTEAKKTAVTKILVVIYGVLAMAMSFVAGTLEGTVLQAAVSLIGAVAGPLSGLFLMGSFFPWANKYGAIVGAFCGLFVSAWLAIGSYVTGIPLKRFPYPNGTCVPYHNVSLATTTTISPVTTIVTTMEPVAGDEGILQDFYSLSYMWFTASAILTVIIVGLIVSFITGANSMDDVPTKYQIPVFKRLCCCLPDSWLYVLGCRRHFEDPENIRTVEKDTEIIIDQPGKGSISKPDDLGIDNTALDHDLEPKKAANGGTNFASSITEYQDGYLTENQDQKPPRYQTLSLDDKTDTSKEMISVRF